MVQIYLIVAALTCSVLAFALRPKWALCVYCCSLFCYPQSVTMAIGGADFTLARIVIMPLLINIVLRHKLLKGFKWNWLDTLVVVSYAGRLVSLSQMVDPGIWVVREGGTMFDTLFPYFAVRMILTSREDWLTFVKMLVIVAIPLAFSGAFQSKTGRNPTRFLKGGQPELVAFKRPEAQMRYGFYRAGGTFGNSISFGLFFAALAPLCLALWQYDNRKLLPVVIGFGCMGIGLVSSMSSAPAFSIVFSMMVVACYPWRKHWPVLAVAAFAAALFVEVYSNRHFYHVLTLFAMDSRTAYYRIELIEEAFGGGMRDHWIFGYGYVGIGPGNDNTNFHWRHIDMTNLYIGLLARTGLVGLLPFLVMNVLYYFRLYRAAKQTNERENHWIVWCLTSTLVGWNMGMMTVGALEQNETFFYMLVAMANNMPVMMAETASAKSSPAKDTARGGYMRNRFGHIMRKKHA